jgi:phosphomannomutase/phosphoglucomutase
MSKPQVGQAKPGDPESRTVIQPKGFREYDARWLYPDEINLRGARELGLGFGTLLYERGAKPEVVTGHDYRSYSAAVKEALIEGLIAAGSTVYDIGLAITPAAYYAQFALDVPAVAMVTASHNPNGWTGVKMGLVRPFTLEPKEVNDLKNIVVEGRTMARDGGRLLDAANIRERYIAELTARPRLKRRLRAVVACGNGTAGVFAPQVLNAIGCEVVPLHCELDDSFPHYDPNPEDLVMLKSLSRAVLSAEADIGFAFDGDGDRCGVVDNEGSPIFADKVGVLLARAIAGEHANARFVVDVKSTALFQSDPVLRSHGATTEYWKTGHSYIKRRTAEVDAIAGFEKSGHFFFRHPLGRGYDDGLLSAIAVCSLLDRANGRSMAELYRDLPVTWGSPTMSPHCSDETKYGVVERVMRHFQNLLRKGDPFAGARLIDLNLINGVRATLEDGSWCLIRASSNKPELVVVCESPVSETRMRQVFAAAESLLSSFSEIGEFNQKL